jgi:hypothetical protein
VQATYARCAEAREAKGAKVVPVAPPHASLLALYQEAFEKLASIRQKHRVPVQLLPYSKNRRTLA